MSRSGAQTRTSRGFAPALTVALALHAGVVFAGGYDWTPTREESVVEVLTADSDGALRETSVWIVVVEGCAYVRTNDSRWLANIRRGSVVRLRVREVETAMSATEVADAATQARVEAAFKAKYGWMQRAMSALRMREPTVLALVPKA